MKKTIVLLFVLSIFFATARGQSTAFTYQGSLLDNAAPPTAQFDFEFRLFDALSGGNQIGATQTKSNVTATNGAFTVTLDFGAQFPGAGRYLEIAVRHAGSGPYVTLTPRQLVTSSPYAVRSISSENAVTATNSLQLGGIAATQYVLTADPRLSDARSPTPGSSAYIQNATSPQAASNFNISGNGQVGGTLSAGIVTVTNQFNIGGIRILSNGGLNNLFAGASSGESNTTGGSNSFFGTNAGHINDTGSGNSFFGNNSGNFNFTGLNNSFFGAQAGFTNSSGSNNTILGAGADVATNNLSYATAIGSGSIVSTNNTIVLGRGAGQDSVNVPGSIYVDSGDLNNGALTNGLIFGNASGEGISSKRTLGGNRFGLDFYTAFVRRMSISQSGVVSLFSLGTAGGTPLCRNAGNEIAFCSSSLRYKRNISRFTAGMSFVKRLRPIAFNWITDGSKDVGFGAEDVAKIDRRFVTYNDKGEVEGVKYDRLSVAFVNALTEQQTQIEQQRKMIESQQAQIDALTKLVCGSRRRAAACRRK